ncbi:MAG TPA: helix-turn-helix transcriptional regulator [Xanthobacteraceae bacterium]|nr:helix-turn-helix transcriptional regulator [Xanthobacteraceae bacterium]
MDIKKAAATLAALAQPTRLAVFRRLIAAYPDGLAAGEIARLCRVPHNTMSSHLASLARNGLVVSHKQSRAVIYRADLAGFRRLVRFLTRDCCNGRADICAPLLADLAAPCGGAEPAMEKVHD